MHRIKLNSSSLSSVGYDPDRMILEVEFTSGAIYQYQHVPKDVYLMLATAESHGQFFNKNIRDAYTFVRINPDVP